MGWSCRADAARTRDAWAEGCYKQTQQQNTFEVNGIKFFWETSRTEHGDGAITGTIWRFLSNDTARKSGTFRIEGDGTIKRAPAILKRFAEENKKPDPGPILQVSFM